MSGERTRIWATLVFIPMCLVLFARAAPCADAELAENDLVTLRTDAGTFELPYGYLAGRPPMAIVKSTKRWEFFSFAFSMPSAHYFHTDILSQRIGHTEQADEPPGSFPVIVAMVTPLSSKLSMDPETEFDNVVATTSEFDYQRVGDFLQAKDRRLSGSLVHYFARKSPEDPGTPIKMLIDCFDRDMEDPPPLCSGTVQDQTSGVRYTLQIPFANLTDAIKVTQCVHDLLHKWRRGA